jgi:methyl-accepting chemotaxis protein
MRRFTDIPIRLQLILITMLASTIALLLAGAIIVTFDILGYREQKTRELTVQAEILAAGIAPSLVFSDPKAAQGNLDAFDANPEILAAGVYTASGAFFAGYSRAGTLSRPLPANAEPKGLRIEGNELVIFWPAEAGKQQVGTVYLRLSTEPLVTRVKRYGGIILLVMAGSLLITLPISMQLHSVISKPIREISEAARQIANGDLTVGVTSSLRADEVGTLVEAFRQMLENLRGVMRQIAGSAEVLTSSSGEIVTTAAHVASGAVESASVVNETTATVEELKQAAQLSADKARDVSERAQKAVQVAQLGNRAVTATVEGIDLIGGLMASVAESILKLSDQTQAIGEIIMAVNDFAQQSNLLSVNAAIEASKAGEHGKGFIVVAQEIRNLADQSKQATEQVRTILLEIQKATSAAVMAAEQVGKAVDAGAKQSTESGESIKELAVTIAEAALSASQIAVSSQQQLAGMEQVALAMESIKQAAQQNVSGTKQAEQAAHTLNELGQKLKEMVGSYKV